MALPVVDLAARSALNSLAAAVGPRGPGFLYLRMPPGAEALAKECLDVSRDFWVTQRACL